MVKDIEMMGQNFENALEFWMKTKLVSSELWRQPEIKQLGASPTFDSKPIF